MDASPSSRDLDASLARQARAGDLSAFEQLVARHQKPVFHFLLYRCGNRQDAEDMAQTTFLAAFRALERFDDRHTFYTWIFTIARRQCIDLLRRRRVLHPLEEADLAVADASPAGPDDAGARLWDLARAHLSAGQVEALWLVYKDDRSIEDAAQALGWTRIRVKVTLHRARAKLKRLLSGTRRSLPAPGALPLLHPEKS